MTSPVRKENFSFSSSLPAEPKKNSETVSSAQEVALATLPASKASSSMPSDEQYQKTLSRVKRNGLNLQNAPKHLLSDPVIVQAAIQQNSWALTYASTEFIRQFSGFAKRRYPDGKTYKGPFQNGRPHGKGSVRLSDGTKYKGMFRNGQPRGKGKFFFPDNSKYEGSVLRGKMHGWGEIRSRTRGEYRGAFVKGRMEGQGILISPSGTRYIGRFAKGLPSGKGKIISPDGSFMEGHMINGLLEGEGKFVCINPRIVTSGTFKQNIFIPDSDLGSPLLLAELFSLDSSGAPVGFSLPIVYEYLEEKGYHSASQVFEQAHHVLLYPKEFVTEKAKLIEEQLIKNPNFSQLFYYGSNDHSMGLQLRRKNNDFVEINFFNAGFGLEEFHKKDEKTGKFQTQLRVQVPLDFFSYENIADIILSIHINQSIYEAYNKILYIVDAEIVDIEDPIYQTPQKTGNCEIAWIFAYLRNTMELGEYKKMRSELLSDARKAGLRNKVTRVFIKKNRDLIDEKCERKANRAQLVYHS